MSNNQTPANSNESTVNILVDRIRNTKLYKYFSTDTASKIALITAIITAGSFVIRLLNYLYWKGYLSIFSFNLGYVDFSINQGFQEFLLHAIVFIGLAVATSLSYLVIDYLWSQYNLIYHKYKLKLHLIIWHSIKGTIKGLPLMLFIFIINSIFNSLLWIFISPAKIITYSRLLEWCVVWVTFACMELIFAVVLLITNNVKNRIKHKEKENKRNKANHSDKQTKVFKSRHSLFINISLSYYLLYIFMLCTLVYFWGTVKAHQVEQFKFVEEHYAVIYQDNNCYWSVPSHEDGDILYLDTTKQKVFEIIGTEVELRNYEDVVVEYN